MNWREYEEQISDKFRREFPGADIQKNIRLIGKYSRVPRQIDILIKSQLVGHEILGVVECKYFSKKVDVKVVDSFIGFLEDVGANLGIIITNEGFSKAAKNRAEIKGIKLTIINFKELEYYRYDFGLCKKCNDNTFVNYDTLFQYIDDCGDEHLLEIGWCKQCKGLHIRCQSCGVATHITQRYTSIKCQGGCGLRFLVDFKYDSYEPIKYEVLNISYNNEEPEQSIVIGKYSREKGVTSYNTAQTQGSGGVGV